MAVRRICGPAHSLRNENQKETQTKDENEDFTLRLELSSQVSWLNLRKALGLSDVENSIPSDLISFSIVDILNGKTDLRVTRMVAFVLSVVHTPSGIWSLTLTDHSSPSTIDAFVTPKAIELYPSLLIPGTSFLAENVAIFVSNPSCQRILNLHERCIAAMFPSQNTSLLPSENNSRSQDYFQEEEEEEEEEE